MAVSILEALQNANYNLDNLVKMPMLLPMVKSQLNNAIVLLKKGYGIWDEVEPLLEEFGDVENVPEKMHNQRKSTEKQVQELYQKMKLQQILKML